MFSFRNSVVDFFFFLLFVFCFVLFLFSCFVFVFFFFLFFFFLARHTLLVDDFSGCTYVFRLYIFYEILPGYQFVQHFLFANCTM